MTIELMNDGCEDRDLLSVKPTSSVHLNQLPPQEGQLIQNTHNAALSAIGTTDQPHSSDRLSPGRVTEGAPEAEANAKIVQTAAHDYPYLAWEAVKAGLAKERLMNQQLDAHIAKAEAHQKNMDLLLDLNAELTAMNDGGEMNEKITELLRELKERGMNLWPSKETKLTKEKISQLKSLATAQGDKEKQKLHMLFTTKMQVLVQNNSAIMEALKDIVKNNTRLISTVVGHYAGR